MRGKSALLVGLIAAMACQGTPRPSAGDARPKAAPGDRMRLAERIYQEGVLPSGEPLRAVQEGAPVSGARAACAQCHRRSGMGSVEGTRVIPPITGRYLHQPRARTAAELDRRHTRGPDLAHAFGRDRPRDPYTGEALARAIREGKDPAGGALSELMPRYALSEADARLLVDYLDQLSAEPSPGVASDTIHLGTVVAPGVDPPRRSAMFDVLAAFFGVRNAKTRLEALREQAYPASAHKAHRTWQLHVWELAGAPETWGAQLAEYEKKQPVFALVSGVSEGPWAPVQAFCEERRLPCWFPTVDLPGGDEAGNHYTTYFTGGVRLEAGVLARRLRDERAAEPGVPGRVIQVRGGGAAAAGAARALAEALSGSGIEVEERVLPAGAPAESDAPPGAGSEGAERGGAGVERAAALRGAMEGASGSDVIVFWLRAPDVERLAEAAPPSSAVYFSATLAGGERAPLSPAWKARARLLDPFELPGARKRGMARFHAWLRTRGIALVDERLQADAYLACLLLEEKIDEMLEDLYRDYLLERAEGILSMRLTTGMYRRLGLGPDQRFASKAGHVSRFAGPDGPLVADGEWIVPE